MLFLSLKEGASLLKETFFLSTGFLRRKIEEWGNLQSDLKDMLN